MKIIYPAYIDARKSKKHGRRIAKQHCIANPKIEEIAEACKNLGFECEVEREKAYPRAWWEKGRVIVKNENLKKLELLKKIANEIKVLRAKGEDMRRKK